MFGEELIKIVLLCLNVFMSALSSDTLNYDDHVDLVVEDFLLKKNYGMVLFNVPSNIVKILKIFLNVYLSCSSL